MGAHFSETAALTQKTLRNVAPARILSKGGELYPQREKDNGVPQELGTIVSR